MGLISTGISRFDSSLLSADADGSDAYFFTRDTLVPEDHNGSLAKIYDAREGGGFPFSVEPVPCKASDECHGAGTQAPDPPVIHSITGAGPSKEASSTKRPHKKHPRHHKKHKRKRHATRNHG